MRKRLLCALVAVIMMFSLSGTIVLPAYASGSLPFTDISTKEPFDHYYDAIEFVYDNGIMNGVTETTFEPNTTLTRAMFVTMLYRLAGEPELDSDFPDYGKFTDVSDSRYYYEAVYWALDAGITTGMTNTTFGPNETLTKQQVMTFLWRYLKDYKKHSYTLPYAWDSSAKRSALTDKIKDYSSVGNSAKEAVNWALNCGIVSIFDTTFDPKELVTRQNSALYLHRFTTLALSDMLSSSIYVFRENGNAQTVYEMLADYNDLYSPLPYENAAVQYGLDYVNLEYAFYNSTVMYYCTHGEYIFLQANWGESAYGEDVPYQYENLTQSHLEKAEDKGKASQAELIYISACNAGQSLVPMLASNCHAETVVGFTESIKTDASCYFDERFFYYYSRYNSPEACEERALEDLYDAGYNTKRGTIDSNNEPFCGIDKDSVVIYTYPLS